MSRLAAADRWRPRIPRPSRGVALVAAALAALAAGLVLHATGALAALERESVAARFQLRGERPPSELAVVAIDDVTFSELQRQWPFPRSLHGRVVERLAAAGAEEIVYDVQFTEPSRPAEDLALYRSIERSGGAVLATTEVDRHGRTNVLGGDENLKAIGAVAASSSLPVDPDGRKTRVEHSVDGLGTLASVVAARVGGARIARADFRPTGAWIDYRGGAGTIDSIPFSAVLRGRFDRSSVRGKVVVVGATAPSLQDVHATPAGGGPMSGPEVQANAIWTALHGLPLRTAPPVVGILLLILLAAAPAVAAARLRIVFTVLLVPVLGTVLLLAAQWAFGRGWIVDVAAPLATLAISTVTVIVASHVTESRERRRVAIENEVLDARVRERTAELYETQLEVVRRLALAAESRDEETGAHIDRISRHCHELALALGVDTREAELIRHASVLHDVGKIGIPDRILLKPGKLDPDELEVMKSHARIGASILTGSRSPLLQLAETIALTHHERWDGSGYPEGMRADEIPLAGRICAICDVYDALISERPYKRAWAIEEALAEIERGSGTHFDPRLVETFIRLAQAAVERDRAELERWQPSADSLARAGSASAATSVQRRP